MSDRAAGSDRAGVMLLGALAFGLLGLCLLGLGLAGPAVAGPTAAATTLQGVVGAPASWHHATRGRRAGHALTGSGAELAVSTAEQAFGLRLLDEVASADPADNVATSPLSLAQALAMLETGAAGATLEQIAATLGTATLTPAEQDLGWLTMTAALSGQARADGISLDAADGLWLQAGFPLRSAFLAAMRRWFGTGVSSVDFAHHLAAALASIDAWVSTHTHGKITQLFGPGQLGTSTRLVLASAVYFDAAWQDPFDPARTVAGNFTAPAPTGPTSVPVKYMTGIVTGAATAPRYDVARLAYRGGHDEAIVVMPLHESLPAFIAGLGPARLDAIIAAAPSPGLVQLPRFTTTSDLDLEPALSAMGMAAAFTNAADLSALSPVPTSVQSVVQRDYLGVGEAGTQAAAATGISVAPTAVAPVTRAIVFDHPFLFLIRNATTGALLFASAVEDPTSGAP